MITVLLHNIFPHSKQPIPLSLNRTPPPMAHSVIRKGGPSMLSHLFSLSLKQEDHSMYGESSKTSAHSDPVDIDLSSRRENGQSEDVGYPCSSVEDEFYSPPTTPTRMSPVLKRTETTAKTTVFKENFFTPTASTPEILRKMVNDVINFGDNGDDDDDNNDNGDNGDDDDDDYDDDVDDNDRDDDHDESKSRGVKINAF